MIKHNFYLSSENIKLERVIFTEKQKHKIKNVLRLTERDFVNVLDGNGNAYTVTALSGEIKSTETFLKTTKVNTRLYAGITKFPSFELILQKAVEIGIDEVIPVITARSVVKLKDAEKKVERFKEIAISAFCQSKRVFLPEICSVCNNLENIKDTNDLKLVFYEIEKKCSFKETLEMNREVKTISVFIGPEGGLEKREISILQNAGFTACKLTDNILKSETAVLFALSCLYFFYE